MSRVVTRLFVAAKSLAPAIQSRPFIIRNLDDVRSEGRVQSMQSEALESRRYLLRKDGMGFSFHQTVLRKGRSVYQHYANHVEAVFVTEGTGWIEVVNGRDGLGQGNRYDLQPGVMYALDAHDRHWLGANTDGDLKVLCVFVPPCDGAEVHDENGIFPYIGEDGKPNYNYWQEQEEIGQKITVHVDVGYDTRH